MRSSDGWGLRESPHRPDSGLEEMLNADFATRSKPSQPVYIYTSIHNPPRNFEIVEMAFGSSSMGACPLPGISTDEKLPA